MATQPSSSSGRNWTAQATDTIETVVLTVKDKTTVPAQTAARGVVYGLVIAVVGVVLLVVTLVAAVRVADVWLLGWAGRVHGQHRLYIAYLVLGMLSCAGGFTCWARRTAKEGST
jgi:hypothetical protein